MAATQFSDPSAAAFREQVRRWLDRVGARYQMPATLSADEQIAFRRLWEKELFAAGYNGLSWPVAFGGRGLGPIEDFVFAEECLAAKTPEPLGRIGRLLAAPGLFAYGTPQQQSRFLPAILEGRDIWCQGFSEPGAGSDLAGLRTTARRRGDRYLISGQKIWTTAGHYADRCLLLARTGEAGQRHRGLSVFLLPMHQSGVEVRPIVQISGQAEFNEVFFDNAEVPEDCLLGPEDEGWRVAMTILGAERGASFSALKIIKVSESLALLEQGVTRRPELREQFAALNARFSILKWHTKRAIEKFASARNAAPTASILKLAWSELQQDAVRFGFEMDDVDNLARWRQFELSERYETIASGTSEIQRNIVAERVLGLPR